MIDTVSDNYFNCLIEICNIKKDLEDVISLYVRNKNANVSIMEVILLYLIMSHGGSCYPRDLDDNTEKFATNNTYNVKNLVKKGFVINEDARLFGLDARLRRLTVTKVGREFYKGLCDYIADRVKEKNIDFEDLNTNMFDPMLKQIIYLRNNIS